MAKEEKTYLVADLAEELDVQEATARGMLRREGIEKEGKQYEWNKTAFDRVVKQLEAAREKSEPQDKKKAAKKVPAKKAKKTKETAEAA